MGPIHNSEIQAISDSLILEIVNAVGLPKTPSIQRLFRGLFHRATDRLATIGLTTDRILAQSGSQAAAEWMCSNFCRQVISHGRENIPSEGPLLIISNHSGTVDSILLASQVGREDFKFMANDIQFFKRLPHIADHAIFLSGRIADRISATRAGIRHLKNGGTLLVFGTGRIDPDPQVYPHAEGFIDRWSPSIDLFLRSAPEIQVVLSIISGVLSKRWGHHPLTYLRRTDWERRRLAEFGQVLQQLFLPGKLYLDPHISFAPPIPVDTLRQESASSDLLSPVIRRGKALFEEHCRRFDL